MLLEDPFEVRRGKQLVSSQVVLGEVRRERVVRGSKQSRLDSAVAELLGQIGGLDGRKERGEGRGRGGDGGDGGVGWLLFFEQERKSKLVFWLMSSRSGKNSERENEKRCRSRRRKEREDERQRAQNLQNRSQSQAARRGVVATPAEIKAEASQKKEKHRLFFPSTLLLHRRNPASHPPHPSREPQMIAIEPEMSEIKRREATRHAGGEIKGTKAGPLQPKCL